MKYNETFIYMYHNLLYVTKMTASNCTLVIQSARHKMSATQKAQKIEVVEQSENVTISKEEYEQLLKQKELIATNKVKIVKEVSDIFITANDEPYKMKNLPTTLRYFEIHHFDICENLVVENDNKKMKCDTFHKLLASHIKF